MVQNRTIGTVVPVLMMLAACSSDHPIPPLEVGSSARLVSAMPKNTRLVDQDVAETSPVVETAYPEAASSQSIARIPLVRSPTPQRSIGTSLAAEQDAQIAIEDNFAYDDRRDPSTPMTLNAQAEQLGGVQVAAAPVAMEPLPPVEEPVVAAEPVSLSEPERPQPAAAGQAKIALSEVMGVGAQAAEPLATRFGARAKESGLHFVPASDVSARYVMKGYFSTTEQDGETYVVYVWDISDRDGNRLSRINGRERGGGEGSGWSAVTAGAMQAVADRTIAEMSQFLANTG